MKKLFILLVAVATLSSCGKNDKKQTSSETGSPNVDSTKNANPTSNPHLKQVTAMFDNVATIEGGDTIDLVKIDRGTRIAFNARFAQHKSVYAMVDYSLFSAEGWKVAMQLYRSQHQRSEDWQNADIDDLQTGQSQLASDVAKLQRENNRLRYRMKKLETATSSDELPETQPGEGRDHQPVNTGDDGFKK